MSSVEFLARPSPRIPGHHASTSAAFGGASLIIHAVAVTAIVALWGMQGASGPDAEALLPAIPPPVETTRLVFLAAPPVRPVEGGGGGGGGGNRQAGPIPRAQAPGHDEFTLPIAPPIVSSAQPRDEPAPPQAILLDSKALTSGLAFQVGSLDGARTLGTSQGPGSGGGVGEGVGTGIGPGRGPGVGPGSGGGIGGGVYRIGGGVTSPTLLFQVKPAYTDQALRTKIQGSVLLELIVQSDGTPRDIRVIRSLDAHGLDREAVRAVEQWRFGPGRLNGTPVDVRVVVQLDFSIQ